MPQYVLSLSYGKDSLACLGAIEHLGWPLDRIVHAEVWATDTIPADLPPMVKFKKKADKIIKDRYGIEVEHICAMKNGKKLTYEDIFYRVLKPRTHTHTSEIRISNEMGAVVHRRTQEADTQQEYMDFQSSGETGVKHISKGRFYGFPISVKRGNWCTQLKQRVFCEPPCTRGREKYCAVSRHCC